jgi:hypothetical protein
VVAFNPVEGWSRDVSEDVANALERHIAAEGREVSEGLRDFIEGQTGIRSASNWRCSNAPRDRPDHAGSFGDLRGGGGRKSNDSQ